MDIDLLNALLLFMRGELTLPQQGVEDWKFDAMSFAQANDIMQFVNTEEYQLATLVAQTPDMGWFHFFEVTL
jgi:hypothetical protein